MRNAGFVNINMMSKGEGEGRLAEKGMGHVTPTNNEFSTVG